MRDNYECNSNENILNINKNLESPDKKDSHKRTNPRCSDEIITSVFNNNDKEKKGRHSSMISNNIIYNNRNRKVTFTKDNENDDKSENKKFEISKEFSKEIIKPKISCWKRILSIFDYNYDIHKKPMRLWSGAYGVFSNEYQDNRKYHIN